MMDTLDTIRTRKSIREFEDREIPQNIIKEILHAAQHAPSGGNRQPWRFIVVTDPLKIKQFDDKYNQPWVKNAPAVIVACADPHDTWEKYDEDDHCYMLDTAAAIQNLILAIHDQGLGAVWVLSCSKHKIRKLLNIPLHWQIISIIPFGYPNLESRVNRGRRSRKPLSEIAFLESVETPFTE
jgi:nitroreductase